MGRYSSSSSQRGSSTSDSKEPSALSRGIGCLLMIIVPAISIFIGTNFVNYALTHHIVLPPELLGRPVLPDFINNSYGLRAVFGPLAKIQNLYASLLAALICMILISSLGSFIYAVVVRIITPSPYGPYDEPPPKRKTANKSR